MHLNDLLGDVTFPFLTNQRLKKEKRFHGYDSEAKSLIEDEEAYKKQLSRDIKLDVIPGSFEGKYTEAHAAIRADSSAEFPGRAIVKYPEKEFPGNPATKFIRRPVTKKKKVVKKSLKPVCICICDAGHA